MPGEPFEPLTQALREQRTKVCAALIKLRHAMLGKAHAWRSSNAAVAEAYEACASMVGEFIGRELGREGEENGDPK